MFDFSFDAVTVKAVVTLLILAAAMYGFVSEKLAHDVTALLALLALLLTGVLTPYEAFSGFSHPATISVAAVLVLSAAVERTGALTYIARRLLANWLAGVSDTTGPYVVLAGFFVLAVVVSELMSNSGTVALLGPITISVAAKMGISPMSLLVAITFGSSAAFAMPIGYQTSLMIYGPGGYRFRDFILMGLPLDLILAALALLLIPYFWPLAVR